MHQKKMNQYKLHKKRAKNNMRKYGSGFYIVFLISFFAVANRKMSIPRYVRAWVS